MPRLNRAHVKYLQKTVTSWFAKEQRKLVWRSTFNPYKILVSEVMLQQTQVSRVKEKLPTFLKKFPTLRALAYAPKPDVVRAWQGLGYNNRAIRLREMANIVVKKHSGRIPSNIEELLRLPGVGKYTAHAVACFAYKQHVPLVDVNVRRVFSRFFWQMKTVEETKTEKIIWEIAEQIVPKDTYAWNQGLMDLGAMICTARKPLCGICPVATRCASRSRMKLSSRGKRAASLEPSYEGLPVRIWRGRIVETLRGVNGNGSLTLLRVGQSIKKNFRHNEIRWLEQVIDALVRDGIAQKDEHHSRAHVSLATE
jgi:A/G-specific adenine glycosylase